MGTLIHTKDKVLMQCIAAEVNRLAGMIAWYFRLDKVNSDRRSGTAALYDEPNNLTFLNLPSGLEMPCFGVNPQSSLTTGDEGRRKQWDGEVNIAVRDWERQTEGTRRPREGDVILCWEEYYDVTGVHRDGIIDDSRLDHTGWKLDLRRNTKFEAWRRLGIDDISGNEGD
jgi:hypothetical protein